MTNPISKNLIVVCGPTASGKTRLGVQIALRYNGEIISCDSRQVYRGMDIGTGKDLLEYTVGSVTVSRHLIDIADPAEVYTVYNFKKDFYRAFGEITRRNKLPVVVGGTGLYLESVLRNYDIPAIPEDKRLRDELMTRDKQSLKTELARRAPDLHLSTDIKSKKRIVRGLEIAEHRNPAIPHEQKQAYPDLRPVVLGVTWDRQRLKDRINERLTARFQQGMVDEVKRLLETGISAERLSMFGMEYRHIARFIAGTVGFDEMVLALRHDIEQLSKRQSTYFRGMERRGVPVQWVSDADLEQALQILGNYVFESS
jgi:tRNA dimethylallyltransferase